MYGVRQTKITESYLKDFKSAEARKEYVDYSPIGQINLYSTKKSGKQKNRRTASSRVIGRGKLLKPL